MLKFLAFFKLDKRLCIESEIGLSNSIASRKVWLGTSNKLIVLILDLSFIDEAISTSISVEVSSPKRGTTISAFLLLIL